MTLPQQTDTANRIWQAALRLPCALTVEIPVPRFTVGDLLRLRSGEVVNTTWAQGSDVAVRVNHELIGWAEFEVVSERLAVRMTELA
jgi:flagellar motor switch/type III secretory pathway protein FliN